jgi:hypothetical protein
MSCLYSSPEVTSVEVLSVQPLSAQLDCRRRHCFAASAMRHAHRIASAVHFHTDFAVRRGQQTRAPQQSGVHAGCIKSFPLPKQAQVSRVIFQAQYQAFVRFAVRSGAAL